MIFYWVILGFFALIGWAVSNRLKSKFAYYSKIPVRSGMTGAEVARTMLRHFNIHDVKIVEGRGFLSDHYNPLSKTIALSPDVYRGRSISASAVAAHECGHAVQHATAYNMLTMRSKLVPIVQLSAQVQQFLFMGVVFGLASGFGGNLLLLTLVATFGVTALFSLITLPVEFDASRRALLWLDQTGAAQGQEYDGAKDALWWAAMTYVVRALGALTMFLYFLFIFLNRR